MRLLEAYGWPGNVRELRNAVERAMLLADGDALEPADFPIAGAARRRSHGVRAAGRTASTSRSSSASLVRAGARAHGLEPDARGHAARHQPRPDPLPDREVQARPGRAKILNIAILL